MPDVTLRAIGMAELERADHVTLTPGRTTPSPGVRASAFLLHLSCVHLISGVNRDRPKAHLGLGAFNLVRSAAYRRCGGYEALRLTVLDDVKLALLLRRAGNRTRAFLGADDVQVHWGTNVFSTIKLLEKNLFASLDYDIPMALGAVAFPTLVMGLAVAGAMWGTGAGLAAALSPFCLVVPAVIIARRVALRWCGGVAGHWALPGGYPYLPCKSKLGRSRQDEAGAVDLDRASCHAAIMIQDPYHSRCWPARSIGLFITLAAGLVTVSADWPEFRGPTGDGHVAAPGAAKPAGLPLRWSETENITWKTEIPFKGWSTPVIMGGQVWLTTATPEGHDYFAIGVDQQTGKILFNEKVFHTDSPEPLGNGASMNCYATPSPVIEPGRVYVHFGSPGTACLDTQTGKVIWQRNDLRCRHYRGASSSPVLFENLLILTFDGADLQYVAALDKKTGETVWKTDRSVAWNDENAPGPFAKDGDLRKAHGTPFIAMVNGKPQLLSVGAKAAYGYDPRTGREIWRVEYNDFSSAPRPVYRQGIAYLVTGFTKKELWAVRADGSGNVTDTHVAWKLGKNTPRYASPLLVDGLLYLAADESFITCVEAASGEVVWNERVGGKYAGSPIYADGRLYFCSQDGATTVVKPGRTLEVLATNKLDGGFMASPAADGRALYLRTKTHLYRVEEKAGATR